MILLLINALRLVQIVVFVRILLTWIMPGPLPKALRPISDPIDLVLKKFQILIPMGGASLDLGPLLFLFLIQALQQFLVGLTYSGMGF